jgi:hypothetical protein
MVRSGFAAPEPAAFWHRSARAECPARVARPELAVQQAVRLERFAPLASAVPLGASSARLALSEAVPPLAEPDALLGAERAEAVLLAVLGAVAERRLAVPPLAAQGAEVAHRQEARAAAEVQHGVVARRAPPSEVDLSVLPLEAAFHAPSRDRARLAPARSE